MYIYQHTLRDEDNGHHKDMKLYRHHIRCICFFQPVRFPLLQNDLLLSDNSEHKAHLHNDCIFPTLFQFQAGGKSRSSLPQPSRGKNQSVHCCISHDATSDSAFLITNVTKLPLIPVPPIIGSVSTFVSNCESLAPFPKHRFIPFCPCPKPCTI